MNELIPTDGTLIPLNELPADIREELRKRNIVRHYLDQDRADMEASQINIDEQVRIWLQTKKSEQTRRTYKKAVSDFFSYLDGIGVNPLLITAHHTDRFMLQLRDQLSANSIRMKLSACSSFYSLLKRYGHIQNNPFHGIELPKKEFKKAVKLNQQQTIPVINNDELNIILAKLEEQICRTGNRSADKLAAQGARKLNLAVQLMATYGMRASSVQTVEIDGDRILWTGKGNMAFSRTMTVEIAQLVDDIGKKPLKEYKTNSMQRALKRLVEKLHSTELIRHAYSAHDFRHYFAVTHYKVNKDIFELQKLLGHASISITQIYLQGLGVEF